MFLNYLAIAASIVMLILSIITAAASDVPYNNNSGRILRRIRITLRDLSFTSVIVAALVILIIGKVSGDTNKAGIWLDIALLFLCFVILHGRRLLTMKTSRKYRRKRSLSDSLQRIPEYKHMTAEARVLPELKELPLCKAAET